ncbi:probable protein phosphatase 2c 25-like [Stylonychia lemnae]|uniref:Probable protein phosphatase 2c 25-like n=1 Tax=Stylonychia lemnae TaxID=5949 RepID=A0A078BDG9_STYLE|nr:probable protein phosphatase 2c 25-like [Stylonychia lemnae]|eukprot:CDW91638.1 probable protein phosphatase 2c 25-like [Stylonychia lemnae]
MTQIHESVSVLKLSLQHSEPQRRQPRSFGSSTVQKKFQLGLKVDLSEDQLKFSEQNCQQQLYHQHKLSPQDQFLDQGSFGVAMMRGNMRKTQEDRFVAKNGIFGQQENGLFAIFDGHLGPQASEFCSSNLEKTLAKFESQMNQAGPCLKHTDQNSYSDGTTALMALIRQRHITIAHLGDSSAFLIRNNQVMELTSEHTPSRIDEYLRIIQSGGKIVSLGQSVRVEGVLEVTRSIGDKDLKNCLIAEPEIHTIDLTHQDQYMILASDGIFKTFTKEQVISEIMIKINEGHGLGQIAELVSRQAHQLSCPDNTTLLIVDLKHYFQVQQQSLLNQSSQIPQSIDCMDYDQFENLKTLGKVQQNEQIIQTNDSIFETEDSSTDNSDMQEQIPFAKMFYGNSEKESVGIFSELRNPFKNGLNFNLSGQNEAQEYQQKQQAHCDLFKITDWSLHQMKDF